MSRLCACFQDTWKSLHRPTRSSRPEKCKSKSATVNFEPFPAAGFAQCFWVKPGWEVKPSVWWVPCSWSKMLCGVCTEHCQTHHHQAFPFPPLAEWDQAAPLIPSVPPRLQGQYLLHPCQESLQLIHLHLLLHHTLLCSPQGRACLLRFLLVL